jgi:L-iditol 2-dehydrogenase
MDATPPSRMRQAVIAAPDRFDVVEAAVPALQGDEEILVRTAACGICSGDLMPWYLQKKVGTVFGHEPVGWAVAVGKAVQNVSAGDLVFVHHHAPCLDCPDCARGAYVHCRTWRASRLDPGGMAEWIRVPAENVRADTFPVRDLSPEQAVFIEPLGCTVKALKRLPRLAGTTGAVVGCGVMGLLNLSTARALGADRLVAVDPEDCRRRLALATGADEAFTPEQAALALPEAMDFVVIGPGHPDVIRQALAYVRPGGTALLFTPTATGVLTPLDLGELYFREVSLVPSYSCGPEDTRHAYKLLRTGKVHPERLVTHRFPLEDVQQAFETARRGGAAVKVLVTLARGPGDGIQ